jgi:DNA modification methylase
MREISDNSINLVITSPPYPMIELWDSTFSLFEEKIGEALKNNLGNQAFELMNEHLNYVWKEVLRILEPGGICCINIGDATRKIGKVFQLYANHVKITEFLINNGFIQLPSILWRKPTNSPTKFLGSGMIPPNAYVTLEHEYILIFRKGKEKRSFEPNSENRYQSAYFWEERNKWFSDLWTDIPGITQTLNNSEKEYINIRERSAAFPFEIPYRLINMFSVYGDTILDPFWGTGTTSLAAIASARNSFGYEINNEFINVFNERLKDIKEFTDSFNEKRVKKHRKFLKKYEKLNNKAKYDSKYYDFNVITKQEREILFYSVENIKKRNNEIYVEHIGP